ncbi:hypothetical protein [Psychrobacter sp. AOP7-A1-24]|uniref:hypothetical protein n=1 Tax=Psychrobacter sp. AOP7-A1-24 TaxID=3457646 RepID=UPI00402B48FF
MFKKISKNFQKKKYNYAPLVSYHLGYQNSKVINTYIEKKYEREITSKNQVKQLSDDFYYELYSFKNLPIHYLLSIVVVAPLVSIASIYFLFVATRQDSYPIVSVILATISLTIFVVCREKKEKLILKKQSIIHDKSFKTIDDARLYWILNKVGMRTNIYEFANKLSKWKGLKEKHNRNSQINWLNYIYDPQSKPRILALFIAFISLFTVVTMNTFEIEPFSVIVSFFGLKHILVEETWLILFLIFLICFLSWQLIFIGHILSRGATHFIGLLNRNNLSELKFNILINFLLDNIDLKNEDGFN